ncbi:AAA family ATPase [Sorangium sp. So ce385]|uniref:AAA family ATPase n=1 Tax=Sorangium sp. So ce385 TaxID=3133308 RepID=UPI003F5AF3E7
MKITFSNLGTIKKTELDLRPLTVIIGPNNSNKTYVAYSLYGLWQAQIEGIGDIDYDELASLKKSGAGSSFMIDAGLFQRMNGHLQKVTASFRDDLSGFFQDSSGKLFSKSRIEAEITPIELDAAIEKAIALNHRDGSVSKRGEQILISASPQKGRKEKPDRGIDMATAELYADAILANAVAFLFRQPLLLPAERNAFIMTYRMLQNRRYTVLRDAQRSLIGKRRVSKRQLDLLREQGDIRYPKPVEDFLEFLTDIELSEGEDHGDPAARAPFRALATDIEESIQNKNKTRFRRTALGGREIQIDVKKGLSIDLYNASSSIKQLTPLLLYLRYRAKPNDFLIIDEPEMNLHPESQAKLLEILGILVNLGVHVLLTTHSPYFMSHLNNLAAGDTSDPEVLKRQAASLYLGDPRAFVPMDKVSAYEMRDNELRSLKDEDYGIRWDTLSDVSSALQQKYFEISETGRAGRGER